MLPLRIASSLWGSHPLGSRESWRHQSLWMAVTGETDWLSLPSLLGLLDQSGPKLLARWLWTFQQGIPGVHLKSMRSSLFLPTPTPLATAGDGIWE